MRRNRQGQSGPGLLLGLAGAGLLGLTAAAWHFANEIRRGTLEVQANKRDRDVEIGEIGEIGEGAITLRALFGDDRWRWDGIWGLEGAWGYGQAGAVRAVEGRRVVRAFHPLIGRLAPGDRVRLDNFAFPPDPHQAHGIAFEEVRYPTDGGPFPAWLIPGAQESWLIFVHGKGAGRGEALRMLKPVTALGYPALVITYRNDREAAASADRRFHYGETEWRDLEGAVRFALERGATGVVPVGYSMGGAIVMSFLAQSPLAGQVRGVILDSPMLDLGAAVALAARQRGIPGVVRAAAQRLAAVRFRIDWRGLDYLKRAAALRTPILLFHGDADNLVPVSLSDALAATRADLVTYERVPGAQHVRSWNVDPGRYEEAVRAFLQRVSRQGPVRSG